MALATVEDIETRLGRALSTEEKSAAEQFILQVSGVISDDLHKGTDWAEELDPVPPALTAVVVGKVVSLGNNPQGLQSVSQNLGSYSFSESYQGSASGLGIILTKDEKQVIRRALGRTGAGSLPLK